MTREQAVQMTLDALDIAYIKLVARRGELRSRVSELRSDVGRRIIDRKHKELDQQRLKYARIPVVGIDADRVKADFMLVQAYEKFLLADLVAMEETPEKVLKDVDSDLVICKSVIASKKESARSGR